MSEAPKGEIEWFDQAGSLDRESRTIRFYGISGEGEEERTLNVAVRWEALELLEGVQTEVRDQLRYSQILDTHRARLEQIAERKFARDDPLSRGYLVIGPKDLSLDRK